MSIESFEMLETNILFVLIKMLQYLWRKKKPLNFLNLNSNQSKIKKENNINIDFEKVLERTYFILSYYLTE